MIGREDKIMFSEFIIMMDSEKNKNKKEKMKTELNDLIDMYHAAIELQYSDECLQKLKRAKSATQGMIIMKTERNRLIENDL